EHRVLHRRPARGERPEHHKGHDERLDLVVVVVAAAAAALASAIVAVAYCVLLVWSRRGPRQHSVSLRCLLVIRQFGH
ncbi:MAG: hypothetical protein WCL38_07445, partial [Actinomycetota bacterium]